MIMVDTSTLLEFSSIHRRLTTVQEIQKRKSADKRDEAPLTACAVKRGSQAKTLVTKPAAAITTLPQILMRVME